MRRAAIPMSAASAPSRTASRRSTRRTTHSILSSATPGKVADDSSGQNSVLVTELLNNIGSKAAGAEALFTKTRIAVSRASNGEQVPSVSSSLLEDVHLAAEMAAEKAGG